MSTYKVKVKILVLRDDFGDLGPHTSPFRIDTLHRVAHDAGDGLGIKSEDIQCDETELIVCSVRQIRSQLPLIPSRFSSIIRSSFFWLQSSITLTSLFTFA